MVKKEIENRGFIPRWPRFFYAILQVSGNIIEPVSLAQKVAQPKFILTSNDIKDELGRRVSFLEVSPPSIS